MLIEEIKPLSHAARLLVAFGDIQGKSFTIMQWC
jgi:hypothetical protein